MLEKIVKPRIDNAIVEYIADKISIGALDFNVERRNRTVLKFNYAKDDITVEISGYIQDKDTKPDVKTKYVVFWKADKMEEIKKLVKKSLEERKSFITKTGDGTLEPVTVIKWTIELKCIRSKGRIFYLAE